MAELTEFGLERRNRTEWINHYNKKFREKFGNDIDLSDSSLAGHLRAILAEDRMEVDKLFEDVYYSRTRNGAEGIYLDDAYGYYGIFREGRKPGTGTVNVHYSSVTPDDYQLTSSDTFSGNNGITYEVQENLLLNQVVSGFLLNMEEGQAEQNALGTYTVSIRNTETSEVITEDFTLVSYSESDVGDFLISLRDFWLDNTSDNEIVIRITGRTLFVGYNTLEEYTSITESTYFSISPSINAEYWSSVPVIAQTDGFYPLLRSGINSYNQTFPGFLEVINVFDFFPGAENQTDAEFRASAAQREVSSPAGTRPGLVKALTGLEDVISVRVYQNPTLQDIPEADALTFNTVVRGGTDQIIGETIYDNKPLGRNTSGTTSITVTTEDNATEVIRFTRAQAREVDVRVTYLLNTNIPLSASERNIISDNIESLFSSAAIGGTIYNTQISNAVLSAVSSERIIDVSIEVKGSSDPVESFAVANVTTIFNEFAQLGDVLFVRSLS